MLEFPGHLCFRRPKCWPVYRILLCFGRLKILEFPGGLYLAPLKMLQKKDHDVVLQAPQDAGISRIFVLAALQKNAEILRL